MTIKNSQQLLMAVIIIAILPFQLNTVLLKPKLRQPPNSG